MKPGGLELKDNLVGVQRVTKVTKGGRNFGFSAIVVVGDENGVVGYGLGKSKDVSSAIGKAVEDAKKNLVKIPLVKGTLPHEQKGKYGGARVNIIPAAPGSAFLFPHHYYSRSKSEFAASASNDPVAGTAYQPTSSILRTRQQRLTKQMRATTSKFAPAASNSCSPPAACDHQQVISNCHACSHHQAAACNHRRVMGGGKL